MNKTWLVVLLCLLPSLVFATPPNWLPFDYNAWDRTMSVTNVIYIDDVAEADPNNIVAAFVDGELRGSSNVFQQVEDDYLCFLLVASNSASGETVSFKIYDASEDDIRDIQQTLPFEADTDPGYPDPFRFDVITFGADFIANRIRGIPPLVVQFTDRSAGNITSWSWDFDGDDIEDATGPGPHNFQYDDIGSYTVTLTISDGDSQDTETKTDYIIVIDQDYDLNDDGRVDVLDIQELIRYWLEIR